MSLENINGQIVETTTTRKPDGKLTPGYEATPKYRWTGTEWVDDLLPEGLVACYDFQPFSIDGTTLLDRSGNGNNGTINGSPGTEDCIIGQAMTFDGTDDHIIVPHDESLDIQNGNYTISVWMRSGANSGMNNPILHKKGDGGFSDTTNGYGVTLSTGTNWGVSYDYELAATYGDGSARNNFPTGRVIQHAGWINIIIEFEQVENRFTAYVAGEKVGEKSFSTSPVDNNHDLVIGAHFTGTGSRNEDLSGALGEIRLYDRLLSKGERDDLVALGEPVVDSFEVTLEEIIATAEPDTDPVTAYDPSRTPPYTQLRYDSANSQNDLFESSDLSAWTSVATNVAGTETLQDFVKVDGTYYVYGSDDTDTTMYSGPDFNSLTSQGIVLSGYADIGSFYENGTYYLFPEEQVSGVSGEQIRLFSSSNPDGPWTDEGVVIDLNDRPCKTGDVDVEKIDGRYWMFLDYTSQHANYMTALAVADDIEGPYEFVENDVKNDLGGDLDLVQVEGDKWVGFTEFTGPDRDGIGRWSIRKKPF